MNETENTHNVDDMAGMGDRIRRAREARNITQGELGAFLGVTRGAVGNWELGKMPTLMNLYKISKKTSVPMNWIVEGPDDMPMPSLEQTAMEVARLASDPALTVDEATSMMTLAFLELGESSSEAAARVLARAVLRAYRTPPDPPRLSLSDEEKRSAVATAIRLYRAE